MGLGAIAPPERIGSQPGAAAAEVFPWLADLCQGSSGVRTFFLFGEVPTFLPDACDALSNPRFGHSHTRHVWL